MFVLDELDYCGATYNNEGYTFGETFSLSTFSGPIETYVKSLA